jgi:hypothetical protein
MIGFIDQNEIELDSLGLMLESIAPSPRKRRKATRQRVEELLDRGNAIVSSDREPKYIKSRKLGT